MQRKFPSTVKVTYSPAAAGVTFTVAAKRDGSVIASGSVAGNKSDARSAAWHALEEIGLVVDE